MADIKRRTFLSWLGTAAGGTVIAAKTGVAAPEEEPLREDFIPALECEFDVPHAMWKRDGEDEVHRILRFEARIRNEQWDRRRHGDTIAKLGRERDLRIERREPSPTQPKNAQVYMVHRAAFNRPHGRDNG